MEKASQIILKLNREFGVTSELIAHKLGVTSRTIENWIKEKHKPPKTAEYVLKQIYNRYLSRR